MEVKPPSKKKQVLEDKNVLGQAFDYLTHLRSFSRTFPVMPVEA